MHAFPQLSHAVLATLPTEFLELEALAQAPDQWERLASDKLSDLLFHVCLVSSFGLDERRILALQDFMSIVVDRLPAQSRLAVLTRLLDYFENARLGGRQPLSGSAFFAFLHDDNDPRIVSTAALNVSVWLGVSADEAEVGRRYAFQLASITSDVDRKAWILGGLAALSDPLANSWVRPLWMELTKEGRDFVCSAATSIPSTTSIDLLVGLCEDALDLGREQWIGTSVGALAKITLISSGQMEGAYSGKGIVEIRRHYPAWNAGKGDVVSIGRSWRTTDYAATMIPRLELLASRERTEPKVVPDLIRYWREAR